MRLSAPSRTGPDRWPQPLREARVPSRTRAKGLARLSPDSEKQLGSLWTQARRTTSKYMSRTDFNYPPPSPAPRMPERGRGCRRAHRVPGSAAIEARAGGRSAGKGGPGAGSDRLHGIRPPPPPRGASARLPPLPSRPRLDVHVPQLHPPQPRLPRLPPPRQRPSIGALSPAQQGPALGPRCRPSRRSCRPSGRSGSLPPPSINHTTSI